MNLSGNKILITGGGSGIGLALTERFLKEGNTVIICGRRRELLDQLSADMPGLITYVCDLHDTSERIKLFDRIKQEHPDLSVLVNNAGIQKWKGIDDADFFESSQEEVNTNILAPIHLCQLFSQLTSLKTIMNVTSGLAFTPLVKVPVYSATKAFFHSFTLSLRHMLSDKIEVIEIIPPALNTDLGGKGLHDAAPPVKDFIESIFNQLQEGKQELTFGFSAAMVNAGPADLKNTFNLMNR